MGASVTAECECGVKASILIGGGMANFMTTCYFPCLCERCHAIVQANVLGKPIRCPECQATDVTPYDDPRLVESAGPHIVAEWNIEAELGRPLSLTDGNYKCPRCGRMTLKFSDGDLLWD